MRGGDGDAFDVDLRVLHHGLDEHDEEADDGAVFLRDEGHPRRQMQREVLSAGPEQCLLLVFAQTVPGLASPLTLRGDIEGMHALVVTRREEADVQRLTRRLARYLAFPAP